MLKDFPDLKHSQIKTLTPTINMNFALSTLNSELVFNNAYEPSFELSSNTFYLIKGFNVFGNVSKEVFNSLVRDNPSGTGGYTFPSFNIEQIGTKDNISNTPIAYGALEVYQKLNLRFRPNSNLQNFNTPKIQIKHNENPSFMVSKEFLDTGLTSLNLGIRLDIRSTSSIEWIAKNWESR